MEMVFEFIFEAIFEFYMGLMFLIVPEEKHVSAKYKIIAILIALVVLLGVLALFIWGCVLIVEDKNMLGWIPISAAIIISIIQIIAGCILHNKKFK